MFGRISSLPAALSALANNSAKQTDYVIAASNITHIVRQTRLRDIPLGSGSLQQQSENILI
jgi:hypothetical protein